MIMKLGMEQYVLKLYKVYINDDPELTLTQFKTITPRCSSFSTSFYFSLNHILKNSFSDYLVFIPIVK